MKNCQSYKCISTKWFYLCTKCQKSLCSRHILFLKDNVDQTTDSSQALCACCFFHINRSSKFVDPILPDPLARALLQEKPKFRDQVFFEQNKYHATKDRCIEEEGCFYPTMASPPKDPKVKAFMVKYSGEREQANAAENNFWNGTVGDTSPPHIEV